MTAAARRVAIALGGGDDAEVVVGIAVGEESGVDAGLACNLAEPANVLVET